jgi:hypothetical protein
MRTATSLLIAAIARTDAPKNRQQSAYDDHGYDQRHRPRHASLGRDAGLPLGAPDPPRRHAGRAQPDQRQCEASIKPEIDRPEIALVHMNSGGDKSRNERRVPQKQSPQGLLLKSLQGLQWVWFPSSKCAPEAADCKTGSTPNLRLLRQEEFFDQAGSRMPRKATSARTPAPSASSE